MKRNPFSEGLLFLLFTFLLLGCDQNPKDSSGSAKAASDEIFKADSLWSVTSSTVDGHMAYFSDNAKVLAPNEPLISGKDAIRKMLEELHGMPGFNLKWEVSKAEGIGSGDMGYSTGTFELTMNDASGNPITDKGKYLNIWKKQADGSWKVELDMINSDLPAPGGH